MATITILILFLLSYYQQTPNSSRAQPRRSVFTKVTDAIKGLFEAEEPAEPEFNISSPYNFKHTHHVQADPHSSTGFAVRKIFFPSAE